MEPEKKHTKKEPKKEPLKNETPKINTFKLKALENEIYAFEAEIEALKLKMVAHETDHHLIESTMEEVKKIEILHEAALSAYIEMIEK